VLDARTFRLEDGQDVRLAGIELPMDADSTALKALIEGRDVVMRANSDTPDRYGRQIMFVFIRDTPLSVQSLLLGKGAAVAAGTLSDRQCALELARAEAEARRIGLGLWGDASAIKNAESIGDILKRLGQFTVVQGRILSVREAGATIYVNFGRRWTEDFAVTIPKRVMPSFEAAGITLKSLERKRVRVRGWVDRRGGPRIQVVQPAQIELIGGTEASLPGKSE